jgi:hypothetical protein
MVNGSMYNPKHPTADGPRIPTRDYIDALSPPGCPPCGSRAATSCPDGTGRIPSAHGTSANSILDLAWFQYYTNEVGHDEYLQWAERVGFEPCTRSTSGPAISMTRSTWRSTPTTKAARTGRICASIRPRETYGVKIMVHRERAGRTVAGWKLGKRSARTGCADTRSLQGR